MYNPGALLIEPTGSTEFLTQDKFAVRMRQCAGVSTFKALNLFDIYVCCFAIFVQSFFAEQKFGDAVTRKTAVTLQEDATLVHEIGAFRHTVTNVVSSLSFIVMMIVTY